MNLNKPIIIAQFWRNRRSEAVVVQIGEFQGRVIVDARVNFVDRDGKFQPTRKGLAVSVHRLRQLVAALAKTERKARELGLLGEAVSP